VGEVDTSEGQWGGRTRALFSKRIGRSKGGFERDPRGLQERVVGRC